MSAYSKAYYEDLKEDSTTSAKEVVPLILQLFPAKTVVDVGCGSGTWARTYQDQGCEILGIDGEIVRSEQLLIRPETFTRRNLMEPLRIDV